MAPIRRTSIPPSASWGDRHVDAITIGAIPRGGELDHPLGGMRDPLLYEQRGAFGDPQQPRQVRISRLGADGLLTAGRHHSVVTGKHVVERAEVALQQPGERTEG